MQRCLEVFRSLGIFFPSVLIWAFLVASSAYAQAPPDSAEPAPPASIATRTEATSDADIANRIRRVFAAIEGLRGVEARVSEGVVTLTGIVPGAQEEASAVQIASRVAGVVTVQNALERDLAVKSNLAPAIVQLGEDFRGLLRALPLFGLAMALAGLIAFAGNAIASVDRLWRWLTPNVFLAELVATFVRFLFFVLGLVVGLELVGATALIGAVLGGAGVVGIAIGFAVRDTVDNYVSSLMLSLRQPFRANDHVVIEGYEGRVVRLTSRATILMTLEGNHLRIPNATVFKAVILNYTRNPERRFEFDLGVDAADDPLEAIKVGLAALKSLDFVLNTPSASAVVRDVGDSNIVLRFFGWVNQTQTDFLKGRSLALQATKVAVENAGFALPEPIYRLRFDEAAPLRFKAAETAGPSRAPATPSSPEARPHDVSPDAHIANLVREERAELGKGDLLDDRKPVE